MRSTTLARSSVLLALAAVPAAAEPLRGCFARDYSAAYLASHPDQVVASMTLSFDYDPRSDFAATAPGSFGAVISVVLANQGHVVREKAPDEGYPNGFGGAQMGNVLICEDRSGIIRCGIECDGGGFDVTRYDSGTIEIRTDYLTVGEGQDCGGYTDLAEQPGQPVSYLLERAADPHCEAQ